MKLKELIEQATPLPWRHYYTSAAQARNAEGMEGTDGGGASGAICQGHGLKSETIAFLPHHRDVKEDKKREANAILLAHAVNMLPKLVEALEEIRDYVSLPSGTSIKTQRSLRQIAEAVLAEANNPEVPQQ